MSGSASVMALQQMLNGVLRPSPGLTVDGLMGPATRAALARYNAISGQAGSPSGRMIVAHQRPGPLAPPPVTQSSDIWMAIAESELGQAEAAGAAQNPRIINYHATTSLRAEADEVPWCSSFVNWVMRQAGFVGTNSAAARSWLGWGTATTARYGAITVIQRKGQDSDEATGSATSYHVGFLIEASSQRVRLLGGNQGDMVKISGFMLSSYDIRGFRWPV